MTTTGLDVSNWQGAPDWGQVAQGRSFAILKATEGIGFVDGRFYRSARDAAAAGLSTGAYHFARPAQSTGSTQASFFAHTIADAGLSHAWLDIEDNGGLGRGSLASWCEQFLTELDARFPGRIGTYCSRSWTGDLGAGLFGGSRGKWIAAPGAAPTDTLNGPSADPDIIQFEWHGRVPSIWGDVDLDASRHDDFPAWARLAPSTPKPARPDAGQPTSPPPAGLDAPARPGGLPTFSAYQLDQMLNSSDTNTHGSIRVFAAALHYAGCGPQIQAILDGRVSLFLRAGWKRWKVRNGGHNDTRVDLRSLVKLSETGMRFHAWY